MSELFLRKTASFMAVQDGPGSPGPRDNQPDHLFDVQYVASSGQDLTEMRAAKAEGEAADCELGTWPALERCRGWEKFGSDKSKLNCLTQMFLQEKAFVEFVRSAVFCWEFMLTVSNKVPSFLADLMLMVPQLTQKIQQHFADCCGQPLKPPTVGPVLCFFSSISVFGLNHYLGQFEVSFLGWRWKGKEGRAWKSSVAAGRAGGRRTFPPTQGQRFRRREETPEGRGQRPGSFKDGSRCFSLQHHSKRGHTGNPVKDACGPLEQIKMQPISRICV